MNPTAAFKAILDNADRVSSFALLLMMLAGLGYITYALVTGKIPSPGDYKRLNKDHNELKTGCKETEVTLRAVTVELADSRVLHAQAVVRIEFLEAESRRKDGELADLRSRFASLETEVNVLRRAQYQPEGGRS